MLEETSVSLIKIAVGGLACLVSVNLTTWYNYASGQAQKEQQYLENLEKITNAQGDQQRSFFNRAFVLAYLQQHQIVEVHGRDGALGVYPLGTRGELCRLHPNDGDPAVLVSEIFAEGIDLSSISLYRPLTADLIGVELKEKCIHQYNGALREQSTGKRYYITSKIQALDICASEFPCCPAIIIYHEGDQHSLRSYALLWNFFSLHEKPAFISIKIGHFYFELEPSTTLDVPLERLRSSLVGTEAFNEAWEAVRLPGQNPCFCEEFLTYTCRSVIYSALDAYRYLQLDCPPVLFKQYVECLPYVDRFFPAYWLALVHMELASGRGIRNHRSPIPREAEEKLLVPLFLSGRRGAGKLQIVESKQSPAPKFLVVCNQQVTEAAAMLRQVGGSGSLVRDVKGGADKRADRIIQEMAAECALAAWVPELSSFIQSGVVVVGVIRIARLYGVSLTRSEAGEFLKEALLAGGAYTAASVVGWKALITAVQWTGVGYFGTAAFDSAFTAAVAWALGTTAKAYFGHELGKGDLKRVVRSSFRQARRQMRRKGRVKQPAEPGTTESPAYDEVSRMLHSRVGREVLGQVALLDPSMARDMAKVLARKGITSFKDLSADALKAVDDETGLVRELWSLTRTLVDTNALLRLALAPDTTYELLDTLVVLQDAVADVALLSEVNVDIFQFAAGSPVAGAIYARHPISQQIFYPIAPFHRMSFEHKFSEALHLLQALGARKLRVHHVQGMRHEGSVSVEMSGGARSSVTKGGTDAAERPTAGDSGSDIGSLKGGLRMVSSSDGELEFEAAYAEREPTLPGDLVWYPRESIWHQIVDARLHHGLQSFDLHVRYTDDFGIDANLVQTLMGIPGHLELGGRYQEFEGTDWRISGSFMGPQ